MVCALGEPTGVSLVISEFLIQHCNPGQHFNTCVLYRKGSFDMQSVFLLSFIFAKQAATDF